MNRDELKKAVSEVAKSVGLGGTKPSAYADLVMTMVEPGHLSTDLFNIFMNVRSLNPGDQLGRKVRKGRFPVRTMVPGTNHLTDAVTYQDQMTYAFDRLIAGVSASVWEIENGEVGTVESLRNDLRADIFDELVSRTFSLLTTVWTASATPSNYIDASSSTLTSTSLDTMIENILDTNSNVKAIVGARKALLPIYTFAQYREFVLGGTTDRAAFQTQAFDEFTRMGKVSLYRGIPLVEIPQVFRNRLNANVASSLGMRERMIPTDKVLVVGADAGEVALYGPTAYQDYTDPTTQPANYVLHAWQQYALVVTNPEAIGVIKVNT